MLQFYVEPRKTLVGCQGTIHGDRPTFTKNIVLIIISSIKIVTYIFTGHYSEGDLTTNLDPSSPMSSYWTYLMDHSHAFLVTHSGKG